MLFKPVGQLLSGDEASREVEHDTLLLVDWRNNLGAVEHEERLHCRVGHTLVAVEEGVVAGERH